MKIVLIRHGLIQGNIEKRFVGCKTDAPLCDAGIQQLLGKVQYINDIVGDDFVLYSSPMIRCIKTCQILFGDKSIRTIDDFREFDFGVFDNKNHMELDGRTDYQSWLDSECRASCPNGECLDSFIDRTRNALDRIIDSPSDTNVIVCHGGTIMAIMSSLMNGKYYDYNVQNCEGYKIELTADRTCEGGINVTSYNRI